MDSLESYLNPFPERRVCHFRTILKPGFDQARRISLGLSIVASKAEEMSSLKEVGNQLRKTKTKPETIGVAEGKNRVTVSFDDGVLGAIMDAFSVAWAMKKRGYLNQSLEVKWPS